MKTQLKYSMAIPLLAALAAAGCGGSTHNDAVSNGADAALVAQGQEIFRSDTFGDEALWTDALHMNDVIASAVDPTTALSVGLKVDAEALPPAVVQGIQNGSISLTDPATTVALLKLNAVVGVKGTVETINGVDTLTRVGITCALCHSTVDDSFAHGIGKRLDGWANRDLNPGAIIALSPAVSASAKAIYSSWGAGKYDPRFNFDGFNGPQVIPPAYGLLGVHSITSTGDGADIAYWNRYVAVTQMGGLGSFADSRTGVNVTNGTTDLVSSKLPALQAYQLRRGGQGKDRLRRCRAVLDLSHGRDADRCQYHPARTRRRGQRTRARRSAELRVEKCDEAVPHRAPCRPVAARSLLPQRQRRHAGRGRGNLRHQEGARADERAEGGFGPVPEKPVSAPGPIYSSSSIERGQLALSRRDRARSARILPPVWQRAQ
jgi:hypothetical protein